MEDKLDAVIHASLERRSINPTTDRNLVSLIWHRSLDESHIPLIRQFQQEIFDRFRVQLAVVGGGYGCITIIFEVIGETPELEANFLEQAPYDTVLEELAQRLGFNIFVVQGEDVNKYFYPGTGRFTEFKRDKPRANTVDVVILSVLSQEYGALCKRLEESRHVLGKESTPNLYAWRIGKVRSPHSHCPYIVTVGMLGRAGTSNSALATEEAITRWKPRYIFFVGIAGGLTSLVKKGDVIIADLIYGYEYGKVEQKFIPRHDWSYETDLALVNGATAFATYQSDWTQQIGYKPPEEVKPNVLTGPIASGDKIVDDPTNDFFDCIIRQMPKIVAVEMEGVGAAKAIQYAHTRGVSVGFLMMRGISDIPRPSSGTEIRGTGERDLWKRYASEAVATFAIGFIANTLPVAPRNSYN